MRISDVVADYDDYPDESPEGIARDVMFLALSLNLFKRDDVTRLVGDRRHVISAITSVEPEKVQHSFFLILTRPDVQQAIAKGEVEDDYMGDEEHITDTDSDAESESDDTSDAEDDDDDDDNPEMGTNGDDEDYDLNDEGDSDSDDENDQNSRELRRRCDAFDGHPYIGRHDDKVRSKNRAKTAFDTKALLGALQKANELSLWTCACNTFVVVGALIATLATINATSAYGCWEDEQAYHAAHVFFRRF